MNSYNLKIPAKALLFGEYGVLQGGKALAFVRESQNLFFEVQIDTFTSTPVLPLNVITSHTESNTHVMVESNFFANGLEKFILSQDNVTFFNKILLPWIDYLKNHNVTIKIKKSFSPALGFGSSSALITAISYALFTFVHGSKPKLDDEFLWTQIRASLKNVQSVASGYDVGVQLAYVLSDQKDLFWIFQNQENSHVPKIVPFDVDKNLISQLGCFVATHIYSNTAQSLKTFSKLSHTEQLFFANEHKKIAEIFLQNPDFSTLKECMHSSLILAQKQGICINGGLFDKLSKNNIPFKTMGSGYGDCLWAATSKERLEEIGISQQNIIFCLNKIL